MTKDICRAITFINYHIPLVADADIEIQYSTVGFFDGMLTERIEINYEKNELKPLWKYGLSRTAKSMGQYSYQNIFCFGLDELNERECSDDFFWNEDTNKRYPLTFVVFLQLREYMDGAEAIGLQCQEFNKALKEVMGNKGIYYTYFTVDKNDFVVCIKCCDYKLAVESIKCLHNTGKDVVYSYSVFSVSTGVLEELEENGYKDIFAQYIDSICLKGITNSFDPEHAVTLDKKYYEFCSELVYRLYGGKESEADYKIYDILGDDDFRLIARDVNLGVLLKQFAKGGMLCYTERAFRFYLFSSNLVLNTLTPEFEKIEQEYILIINKKMEDTFQSPICNRLQRRMEKIAQAVLTDVGERSANDERSANEKLLTFSHAIWQLLQSLKALETAPTKKYDFWSLYRPLSLMIEILEDKMSESQINSRMIVSSDICENAQIYDFIHKISMTLHGTLRTDIQFFQIRDFNVIVHYAPAKLRAFYALWALQLSDFYNEFCDVRNQYSFVCTPGMFRETSVKQLFTDYAATKRLMLIAVPERHLYAPRWLSVILAHEVSHFVGYAVRNRQLRHKVWLDCCARILMLEMNYYRYRTSKSKWRVSVELGVKDSDLYDTVKEQLLIEEQKIRLEMAIWPHEFHSNNSFIIINNAFRNIARDYIEKIVVDDCEKMNNFLQQEKAINRLQLDERVKIINDIRKMSDEQEKHLLALYQKFQHNALEQLLNILRYITTEAYADLTAILTLDLTPLEYILSFSKGELNFNVEEVDAQNGLLLVVRAGITINAIQKVMQNKIWFTGNDFVNNWTGDVLRNLALTVDTDSPEGRLILEIYGYTTGIRNCNNKISSYQSLYNYENSVEDFTNKLLDFYNDMVLWDLFENYMVQCAEDYIKILSGNSSLQHTKRNLVATYKKISQGGIGSMIQEVENFFVKHEALENERVSVF